MIHPDITTDAMMEKVEEHLQPAIDMTRGRITMDAVKRLHRENRAQLWVAMTCMDVVAALVSEISEYASGRKILRVVVMGGLGTMKEGISTILEALEDFARQSDCASVLLEGRRGWERALPPEYQFSHIAMEKSLTQ